MISIIVPVYNAKKYLHRCVDSILAQTYRDFELILVDDGSKDSSGTICDDYAARDSRVRVFHKPNGGVSSARNFGLSNARGEWISFVDSDDWVDCNYLEAMLLCGDADLRICSFIWEEETESTPVILKKTQVSDSNYDSFLLENLNNVSFNIVWGRLFKNSIIKEKGFSFKPNISSGEDTLFMFEYLSCVRSLCVSDIPLYHYRRESSALSVNNRVIFENYEPLANSIYDAVNRFGFNETSSMSILCGIMSGSFYRSVLYIQESIGLTLKDIRKVVRFLNFPVNKTILGNKNFLPRGKDRGTLFDVMAKTKNTAIILAVLCLIKIRLHFK